MSGGLKVRVLMNSSLEDVLGWKCCNLQGMNLEIHVINAGGKRLAVKSEAELEGPGLAERIDYLYPQGVHALEPGEALSFYCSFDERRFGKFTNIIVKDGAGARYRAAISGGAEAAERIE
jgi:hypothetical protein